MRKVIILVIILIFSLHLISAKPTPVSERISLEEGQSIDFNGKRLTLLNLDFEKEKVIVCVNGEKMILADEIKVTNGATLDLRKVTINKADIRIRVNCPGCECDETCDNSICLDKCSKDEDCDDGNDLTEDKCYGNPKRCHYKKIKDCTVDEHCDDMNECTIDKCSELLKKCVHTEKTECEETKEINEKITSTSVINTKKYAQSIHPLLISITIGVMIIAVMIKKFKY
ncbi:MAG: hypothetical protein ISS23_03385 [Nanoarchaeota archaeon]|nr:hypothetical protein [Nanoarchaeota archaeon]